MGGKIPGKNTQANRVNGEIGRKREILTNRMYRGSGCVGIIRSIMKQQHEGENTMTQKKKPKRGGGENIGET